MRRVLPILSALLVAAALQAPISLFALLPAFAQNAPVRPYSSASPITPGTEVSPGSGVVLACTAAGNERLILLDGSQLDVQVSVGTAVLDGFSVKNVSVAGTSAVCTVTVVRVK